MSWLLGAAAVPALAEPVDFNRDVRPILNKNCTTCHGGVKQAGGVSFLYREDALGKGDSGKAVVIPGDPEGSEMMRRIHSEDPEERMPPPKEHPHALKDEEVAKLEQWIREGAEWGEHWSFQKPVEPAEPVVKQADWPKQPLDFFVLAKLEAKGWKPSAEADPVSWLRRVSLDLTGLPPAYEEVGPFVEAMKEDPAKAKLEAVDRLLASPRFGERWASMWLDLARYSDTMGFEKDPHRDIWPYRDWVIDAFNRDLPFDQFTIKQLAGDLLESPEPGDLIATGFHRNTQCNTEGGTDDEEYRMAAVVDRVNTTWTTWMATTFGCVQCHSHPYDPIPHEDYYRFMAFFNNTEDCDLNQEYPRTKVASDAAKQAEAVKLERDLRTSRERLNQEALAVAKSLEGWQVWKPEGMKASGPEGTLEMEADGKIRAGGTNPTGSVFTLSGAATAGAVLKVEIFPEQDDPKEWGGFGSVLSKLTLTRVKADGSREAVAFREVVADFLAGPFDPNEALKDGGAGFGDYPAVNGPRVAYLVPEAPWPAEEGERWEMSLAQQMTCNETQACILRRFRLEVSADARLAEFLATPERQQAWAAHRALEQAYQAIPGTTMPVMRERLDEAARVTRVFIRGNRLTRDEAVSREVPAVVKGAGLEGRADRLAMAKWVVSRENPLTARVMANRLWAEMFGTGIVETQEDFGSSGLLPSHPELLDHLALRLRDHYGWRIKPFLREIALSAAYGQTAQADPSTAQAQEDPRNQMISRGPRQRLTAEMVRDQGLAVSGLLSAKMHGPPVFPPQPDGVWKSVYSGATWNTSQGEDRYRRAVYTYSKRTSGHPAMLTFDAPTRDLCSARRIPTNTPLQALVSLNDPAQLEFAQALVKRMSGGNAEERMADGYRRVTLREPSAEALETLKRLYEGALEEYRQDGALAQKLAPTAEEAALVLVANTLLNLDSVLNR